MYTLLKGFVIIVLFLFLAANIYASQVVDPLFYQLTGGPSSKAAVALLTKLSSTDQFAAQLAFFTDMFGPEFQKEVFRTKTERARRIIAYQQLLQKNPKHRDVLLALAGLYLENEDKESAAIYYKRAKAVDPWLKVQELEKLSK